MGFSDEQLSKINDKKTKSALKRVERDIKLGRKAVKDSKLIFQEDEQGFLEADGWEKTFRYTQDQIVKEVDINSQRKKFDLELPDLGPYRVDYTRDGRYMLIGGRKGHVASFDWKSGTLLSEIQLEETVRDVKWLHQESFYAVAQKKYVYIYDRSGMEVHVLKKHIDVNRLEFLPYHFLLASVGNAGYLHYHDTSTGELVSELRTKLGACRVMAQNHMNGILHLGHSNGTVSLWSPTVSTPLVRMLCHKGNVNALAIDPSGKYMATAGLDGFFKIWDLRMFSVLSEHRNLSQPFTNLSISQRGLLAASHGPHVNIYGRDMFSKAASAATVSRPYLTHLQPGCPIENLQFCPYEDVLALGHGGGISSILIPGSGEPNFDSLQANPFQNKRQRQEGEIRQLLDKLAPDTISLDPQQLIGGVGKVKLPGSEPTEDNEEAGETAGDNQVQVKAKKKKSKSASIRKALLKNKNIIDLKKEKLRERLLQEEKKAKAEQQAKDASESAADDSNLTPPSAINRFGATNRW